MEGALLAPDGVLTPRAERAVGQLRGAGIDLALTSRRPPRGLRVLIERLGIATPVAAFGGAMLVRPDLSVLNPGEVVRTLSALLGISGAAIAAIGEMPDHVFMFRESRPSIAMGHARVVVQRQARFITLSNDDEGFASAVETWLLTASGGRRGRGRTSP